MADFYVSAYSKSEDDILEIFDDLRKKHPEEPYEAWMMEPDSYGNRYVIICRRKHMGRTAKLTFLKRLK